MKKIKLVMAAAMVVSILAMSVPASAQSNPEARTTSAERYDDDDNDTNYSWIGLIGLIGLTGLMKKNNDVRTVRDASSTKY